MSKATSRISSAIHAPCARDVINGVTRSALLRTRIHCKCRRLVSPVLLLLPGHGGLDLAVREAGGDFVSYIHSRGVFEQLAVGVENQRIPTIENGQRGQGFESRLQAFAANAMLEQNMASHRHERSRFAFEFFA